MKKTTLISSLLIGLIGTALLIGCGGGGSKSKSDSSSMNQNNEGNGGTTHSAILDTRSVERVSTNITEIIPGCVFTSNNVATTMDIHNLKAYTTVYAAITTPRLSRADQEQRTPGSCGGELIMGGSAEDMKITFDKYCSGSEGIKTTIDGQLNAKITMTDSDENPQIVSASISTGKDGITTTTVENGQTSTESLYLSALHYTAGDPNTITIDELKINSPEDGVYRLTNVQINQYGDSQTGSMEIKNATYYDPEVGAVTLSTSKLPIGENATGSGSFTISKDGQSATFVTDDIDSAKFDVVQNDKKIGVLDCSATLTVIQ